MDSGKMKTYACRLSALSVFRGMLRTRSVSALLAFLKSDGELCEKLSLYGEFVHSLEESDGELSAILRRELCADENVWIVGASQGKKLPDCVLENAREELALFTELTYLTPDDFGRYLDYGGYIPKFENKKTDFKELYEHRVKNVSHLGYGIFALDGMFRLEGEEIVPVSAADGISADSFIGYEDERSKVIENTRALVEGRPAANTLLFGDAGTGKSSTVKACANMFRDRGLRLIELRKDQLLSLPSVMGRIAKNPLKFIIFIDDLSFNKNDDSFSMLKAALEGSASAKAPNAVIYATSNRRHIVKETFSGREGDDDIHKNDTVQELMSLSDRFGLTVYFSKPSKPLYLKIIHELAEREGIGADSAELDIRAEAFALERGSRSPRAAEQFIKSLIK